MTKGFFKAGDRVKVVDMGEAFNTYDGYFFDNKEGLLNAYEDYEVIYNFMDSYNKTGNIKNNMECRVLYVGEHRYSEYNEVADILLVEELNTNDIYIISSNGVVELSADDMDYKYIADELDKALDILFEVQKHFINHNASDLDGMYKVYKQALNQLVNVQGEALAIKEERE